MLSDEEFLWSPFAVVLGAEVPTGLVVHWDPAFFFGAIVPVFVDLVEHLAANSFEDVADFAIMIVEGVVIGIFRVRHFGVDVVEVAKKSVDGRIQIMNVQAEAAGFAGCNGVGM